MIQVLWTLPVPSTALLNGVKFEMLTRRDCRLACEYEAEDDRVVLLELIFSGVESFKCTHYKSCSVAMIQMAYDKVVDAGPSEWLTEISARLSEKGEERAELRHLIIYFDDGPCYEFICRLFRVEISTAP